MAFGIEPGYEIQIRPRSGLSLKTDFRVDFGTIDSNYKGEIKIIGSNKGTEDITFEVGNRVAQAVLCPVIVCELEEVMDVGVSDRNDKGFGSTGV